MPTNVNIQNTLDVALQLDSSVQPPLGSDYWGIDSTSAPSDQTTRVLWMDRNEGITDGDTWVFTTSFEYAGVAIQLLESLTGTFASSDIKIQIMAGGQGSGWSDENTSLQFKGDDGNLYQIDGTFFLNGSYDDVTYTLLEI
ncbi:MAG TPA: hypothetical protein VGD21_02125 [Lysobacter sp.]